ncbi:hypothetical protein E4U39_001543 [Claviceps sp. Clav50 group G5]|nr:hypothetical protein E4U39_001543 [Claviceps sp. Clav50 group G5]
MESLREKERPFRPATVGPCHVQTATDRFGQGAKEAIINRERLQYSFEPEDVHSTIFDWPLADGENGELKDVPGTTSIYKLVPSMQEFRNNLTALSQKYNLYFTAYRSYIYVYVPRTVPRQTLPRHAEAQIETSPSPAGRIVGGTINEKAPHMINHLAVGALGQEEVVVTLHDDGDVTAFYTKEIADYIRSRFNTTSGNIMSREGRNSSSPAPSRCKVPTPFFKENIGRSAWGLAIHQQSRLIAVSSNRSEITVFAPALKASKSREQPCDCDVCCQGVEDKVRRRARNWRIVVVLGSSFSKLPNISFVDDEHGNADKVTAIDSAGAIWLANIWKPEQAAIRLTPSSRDILLSQDFFSTSRPSQGWGILPLANKYFLTVHSEEELFGTPFKDLELLPKAEAGWNPTVSIYRYNRALPENPCVAPPRSDSDISSDDYRFSADLLNAENDVEYEDDHDLVFEDAPFKSIYTYNDEEDIFRFPAEFKIYNHESYQDEQNPEEGEDLDWIVVDGDDGPPPPGTAFDGDPLNALLGNNVSEWTFEHTEEPDYMSDVTSPSNFESQVELPTMSNEEFQNPWVNLPSIEGSETHSESSETSDDQQGSFSTCWKKTPTHDPSTHQNMTYMPHNGVTCITPTHIWSLIAFLQRPVEHNENQRGRDSELAKTAHRYHMLRLYEKDFEMQPLDRTGDPTRPPEYSVICPRAIRMGRWSGGDLRLNFLDTARLSMVSHIPELFLIVIGSPIGRVMLATPTRLARPIETAGGLFHYGLRLEWVLPRKSDEAVFRTWKRPLHGMAVGPVQGTGVMSRREGKQRAAMTPKRYRLMLHYRNHDIFTYELSREEETGKVCIF